MQATSITKDESIRGMMCKQKSMEVIQAQNIYSQLLDHTVKHWPEPPPSLTEEVCEIAYLYMYVFITQQPGRKFIVAKACPLSTLKAHQGTLLSS